MDILGRRATSGGRRWLLLREGRRGGAVREGVRDTLTAPLAWNPALPQRPFPGPCTGRAPSWPARRRRERARARRRDRRKIPAGAGLRARRDGLRLGRAPRAAR